MPALVHQNNNNIFFKHEEAHNLFIYFCYSFIKFRLFAYFETLLSWLARILNYTERPTSTLQIIEHYLKIIALATVTIPWALASNANLQRYNLIDSCLVTICLFNIYLSIAIETLMFFHKSLLESLKLNSHYIY